MRMHEEQRRVVRISRDGGVGVWKAFPRKSRCFLALARRSSSIQNVPLYISRKADLKYFRTYAPP